MGVLRRFLGALLLGLVVLTAAGFATGRLSSVVTNGVSMQPGYAAGDLVVVMRAGHYAIGDVAAYRDPERHEVVLHRIVGGTPDGYELRGDNNQSIDVATPAADELLGREVLHVPKVGRWLGSPLMLAVLAGVAIALAAWATVSPGGRRGTVDDGAVATVPPLPRGRRWHIVLLALDAGAVAGLVAAFAVPPTVVPPPPVPMHVGSLSYRAEVSASDAYPDGVVATGDTVFARVTDRVEVTFRYEGDPEVAATARLRVVIDAAAGWTTATALAPPTPVVAGGAVLRGTIDMASLRTTLQRVEDATGVTLTTVQLRVEALVDPEMPVGDAAANPYSLDMRFRFDELGLDLAETSVVVPSVDGPVVTSNAPVRDVVAEPSEVGGVPREARRWLVVALLVLVAATVTAWPSGRSPIEADGAAPAAPTVRRVASVELPPVATRVQLASRSELDVIAREAGVPVLERDDGWAVVVTPDALHWWEPPGIPSDPPRWTDRRPVVPAETGASASEPCGLDDVWSLTTPSVHDTPTVRLPVLEDLGVPPDPTVPPPGEPDVVGRLRDELMVPRRPLFRSRPLPPPNPPPTPASTPASSAMSSAGSSAGSSANVASRTTDPTDAVQVRSTIDEIVAYLTEVADRGRRTAN